MGYKATYQTLWAMAHEQGGYFTARQALEAGYTYPEQHYHVTRGNWLKIARGLYRLRDYPPAPEGDLIELTLLSVDRSGMPQGVVSHETALALHELGDANPARLHLTVPPGFRKRLPPQTILHRGRLSPRDWEDRGGYRVTTPLRTLLDVAASPTSWPALESAVRDALQRGVVRRTQLLTAAGSEEQRRRLHEAVEAAQHQAPQQAMEV